MMTERQAMSEIQVLIPLSVFGDAKDLTPQGISEAINLVGDYKDQLAALTARNDLLITKIRNLGRDIEFIWENSINEFDRAKAIRNLFGEMKEFEG